MPYLPEDPHDSRLPVQRCSLADTLTDTPTGIQPCPLGRPLITHGLPKWDLTDSVTSAPGQNPCKTLHDLWLIVAPGAQPELLQGRQ